MKSRALWPLLCLITACASQPHRNVSGGPEDVDYAKEFPPTVLDHYPHYPIRADLGEVLQPEEKQDVEKSINAVTKEILKRVKEKNVVGRGDHTTSHGCYPARVEVRRDLDSADLGAGLARPEFQGAVFQGLVRLSNADTPDVHDLRASSMGLALKIYLMSSSAGQGLQDSDFLLGNENPGLREQDFLAGVHDQFMVKNIHDYAWIFEKRTETPTASDVVHLIWNHPSVITRGVKPYLNTNETAPIIFQKRFFSLLPYGWGSRAAKFSFKPCSTVPVEGPHEKASEARYQQDLIAKYLNGADICYKLVVQTRPASLAGVSPAQSKKEIDRLFPIEDAREFWPESAENKASVAVKGRKLPVFEPYREVATITIAKGTSPIAAEACEKTVYNPWNGLKDHQPLGNLSRARFSVYKQSKNTRYHLYHSK